MKIENRFKNIVDLAIETPKYTQLFKLYHPKV